MKINKCAAVAIIVCLLLANISLSHASENIKKEADSFVLKVMSTAIKTCDKEVFKSYLANPISDPVEYERTFYFIKKLGNYRNYNVNPASKVSIDKSGRQIGNYKVTAVFNKGRVWIELKLIKTDKWKIDKFKFSGEYYFTPLSKPLLF